MNRFQSVLLNILLGIASMVFMLLVIEIGYRTLRVLIHGDVRYPHVYEDRMGWIVSPNFSKTEQNKGTAGNINSIHFQTDSRGSRYWGNPWATSGQKVLFVGDSFTEAADVSNDKTYYSTFAKRTGFDVYAYGVAGYGTLQEYLALQKIVAEGLVPDYLVLQFCSNDFYNNSVVAEKLNGSLFQTVRPYYIDGNIIYLHNPILRMGLKHSLLFIFLQIRYEKIYQHLFALRKWQSIEIEYLRGSRFLEDVRTTSHLLAKMRSTVPSTTKLLIFNSVDPIDNEANKIRQAAFVEIAKENGFELIDRPVVALAIEEAKGGNTRASDNHHWNEFGHQIVGEEIAKYFIARFPR